MLDDPLDPFFAVQSNPSPEGFFLRDEA